MFSLLPFSSLELVLLLQRLSGGDGDGGGGGSSRLDSAAIGITLTGDPKLVFLYLAPLVYWLVPSIRSIGIDVFLSLMYWHDDRVKEFSVTCESGYGMPSGHVMVSTCVAFVLVSHVSRTWRRFARIFAILYLTSIGLTRVYVGAHFPGQVILGGAAGAAIGWAIMKYKIGPKLIVRMQRMYHEASSTRAYWRSALVVGFAFSAVAIIIPVLEFIILSIWTDPLHSLDLAREGCEATKSAAAAALTSTGGGQSDSAQFQLERGPFMGIMRDAGVALGVIIGLAAINAWKIDIHSLGAAAGITRNNDSPPHDEGNSMQQICRSNKARIAFLLVMRGLIGLFGCHLLTRLLAWCFDVPLAAFLAPLSPTIYVYAKNHFLFAAITFSYLVLAPIAMRAFERMVAIKVNYAGNRSTAQSDAQTQLEQLAMGAHTRKR